MSTLRVDKLDLGKTYEFDVLVSENGSQFSGELKLSSNEITLRVIGEESLGREFKSKFECRKLITCHDHENTFFLYGASLTRGNVRVIGRDPNTSTNRLFFSITFKIKNLIFLPFRTSTLPQISGIKMVSPKIAQWLGNTKKQEKIIALYNEKKDFFESNDAFIEFSTDIGEGSRLGIDYAAILYHSSPDFRAGVSFPPALFLWLNKSQEAPQAIQIVSELYSLFAFITGDELDVERILLSPFSGQFNKDASLYYPKSIQPEPRKDSPVFFPLGQNLRFDTINLPPFPIEAFAAFFALKPNDRSLFEKALRYRRLENTEERFLGFFRIFERLTHQKKEFLDEHRLETLISRAKPLLIKIFDDPKAVSSFLQGIPRYNRSKYNTAKCMADFFSEIPTEISAGWVLKKNSFTEICKLRNDISHANSFDTDENKMFQIEKFIEMLMALSLLKLLGIKQSTALRIIPRFAHYHLINPPKPVATPAAQKH